MICIDHQVKALFLTMARSCTYCPLTDWNRAIHTCQWTESLSAQVLAFVCRHYLRPCCFVVKLISNEQNSRKFDNIWCIRFICYVKYSKYQKVLSKYNKTDVFACSRYHVCWRVGGPDSLPTRRLRSRLVHVKRRCVIVKSHQALGDVALILNL